MTFLPNPTVTIDGADVTSSTVEFLQVQRGRRSVYDSESAGYANVRLLASDALAAPQVGSELFVSVEPGFDVDASGGDVIENVETRDGLFQVHRFTSVGTATFTLNEPAVVDVMLVGGGGGGFNSGGGGGGVAVFTRALGTGVYEVVVGGGGLLEDGSPGFDGQPSSFDDVMVPGGGGGVDTTNPNVGADGASGGGGLSGAGGSGTAPFGNDGGAGFTDSNDFTVTNRGGGGGFRFAGNDATISGGGSGGQGFVTDFDGVTRDYASGGGGGTDFFAESIPVSSPGPRVRPPAGGPSGGAGGFVYTVTGDSTFGFVRQVARLTLQAESGQPNTGGGGGASAFRGTGFASGGSGVVYVRIPRKLRVFTGTISDVSVNPVRTSEGLLYSYGVTAVGPLAQSSRRTIFFDGRPAELDGERVFAALTDSFVQTWETYPDDSWEDTDPSLTWFDLNRSLTLGFVDRGEFELTDLEANDGGYNALSSASQASLSGRGVIVETSGGMVEYAALARRQQEGASDPLEFSFNDVQVNSFDAALTLGDVVNAVTVEWSGGVVSRRNVQSIRDLFRLDRSFSTLLADEQDAEAFAEALVAAEGEARFRLQSVSVNLLSVDDAGLRGELLRLPIGRLIRVVDVPAVFGSSTFEGFVEGVDFEVGEFRCVLRLLVADKAFVIGPVS